MNTKRKIEVGKVFSAKVAGTYLPVRIDKALGHGRYEGVVMPDGTKTVKVASEAVKGTGETVEKWQSRQRPTDREIAAPAPTSPASAATTAATTPTTASAPAKSKRDKRTTTAAKRAAEIAATIEAVVAGNLAEGIVIPTSTAKRKTKGEPAIASPANVAASATATATTAADVKPKKTSGLDAAEAVLREAGTPLNCGEMVRRMLDGGLWQTNGRTPSATIYSALHMDIARNGEASRFRKADRGQFALADA